MHFREGALEPSVVERLQVRDLVLSQPELEVSTVSASSTRTLMLPTVTACWTGLKHTAVHRGAARVRRMLSIRHLDGPSARLTYTAFCSGEAKGAHNATAPVPDVIHRGVNPAAAYEHVSIHTYVRVEQFRPARRDMLKLKCRVTWLRWCGMQSTGPFVPTAALRYIMRWQAARGSCALAFELT